jgi:outer membrane protein assembly factor BamB
MRYLDFDLRVIPDTGDDFRLEVASSPAGRCDTVMRFPFSVAELRQRLDAVELATLRLTGTRRRIASPDEEVVQGFGAALFGAMLAGEVKGLYDVSRRLAAQEDAGLRLNLQIEAPELVEVPWEFLYDGRERDYLALGRGSPIVRIRDLPQHAPPLPLRPPLQILGMAASPSDLAKLDVQHERELLELSLADLTRSGSVSLTWIDGQGWRDLQEAMSQGPWHILHFVGHGGFNEEMGEGVIALCKDDGRAHLVSATSLGRLLDDHYALRLVLLNACEGARSAMGALSSSAELLVQRGVPAVVAMQYQITDAAAVQFSHAFYAAVASGQSAVASLTEARIAMSVANERSVEWAVPVLHQRAGSGQLFEIDIEQQPPKQSKSPLKALTGGWQRTGSRTRRIAAIVAGVLSLVALVGFLVWRLGSPPSPDLLWTFRTPGFIASSPTVANELVYFGSQSGAVYGVEAETGTQRWLFQTGGIVTSSAAVVDRVVYIGSQDGSLYALDAMTGDERWRRPLGGLVRSSPAVADGVMYVGSDKPALFAVDAQTGAVVWEFTAGGSVMSSPAVVGGVVFVGSQDGYLYAVDAKTGAERWRVQIGEVFSSPAVADGLVYVGSNDGHLYCVEAVSGTIRWRFPTGDKVGSSPAVADGAVFVGSHDGYVYAVDAQSGGERWRFRAGDLVFSSPTVADGVVYVGSHSRNVYAIDATSGEERWRYPAGAIVGSSPTVVEHVLYVGGDDGLLYALGVPPP